MVEFFLNNKKVNAKRRNYLASSKENGVVLPHLCYMDKPGYRPDGNCRACMVSIEGERVLAASCLRKPTEGMKVSTEDERSVKSRKMVLEFLVTDQPKKEDCHDPDSHFWKVADNVDISSSRFDKKEKKMFPTQTTLMLQWL